MIRKGLLGLATAGLVLVLILALNTARVAVPSVSPVGTFQGAIDGQAAAQRLAGAVRIATISTEVQASDESLDALGDYLAQSFPKAYAAIPHEKLGTHSLLFRWAGSDPDAKPILLAAHQDVVPVEAGTEGLWAHGPFSGDIADGCIWGRGSLDDKVAVLAILESAEALISAGSAPRRTIYFAFGQDEEMGGEHGAAVIAATLKSRGVQLDWVLDEGLTITEGLVPGVTRPVALIGIAEKGYATFDLEAVGPGGHSSIPPKSNPLTALAEAIARIGPHPFASRLTPPARGLLAAIAPATPWPLRTALANLWLTAPLVIVEFEQGAASRALLQTIVTPTLMASGTKDNVVPQRATASINTRILPGDTIEGVKNVLIEKMADPAVRVSVRAGALEPSGVSSKDTAGFALIAGALARVVPEAVVSPGLMIGLTDSRHYLDLSTNTYRFLPLWLKPEDLQRIHGSNERIGVDNYVQVIRFYAELMSAS